MLDEVQQYTSAIEAADTARHAAVRELEEKYPNRGYYGTAEQREQYTAYDREVRKVYDAEDAARTAAWAALEGSSDPLVSYIVGQDAYQEEAMEVLKRLPASLVELDELAADRGWCGVWDRLRDEAVAKGLFGEVVKPTKARAALDRYLTDDYGMGARATRRLNTYVDAIVAEAVAAATATESAPVAEAPASV